MWIICSGSRPALSEQLRRFRRRWHQLAWFVKHTIGRLSLSVQALDPVLSSFLCNRTKSLDCDMCHFVLQATGILWHWSYPLDFLGVGSCLDLHSCLFVQSIGFRNCGRCSDKCVVLWEENCSLSSLFVCRDVLMSQYVKASTEHCILRVLQFKYRLQHL